MKKIDFHIHTIPKATGENFVFSLDTLKEYIKIAKLDAIAITNHNFFDEANYKLISENVDITVFPGIEIDLEQGHILVISPIEELEIFKNECTNVTNYMKLNGFNLRYDDFINLFKNKQKYLMIPHYKKKPSIPTDILTKFGNEIVCGEVSSAKKWFSCMKNIDSLTPVIFSDVRIKEDMEKYPSTLTYIQCDDITIPKIKLTLSDKTKVRISPDGGDNEFQILSDGTTASTGLNIIMGLRSSGKTYTLENILASFNTNSVKYIEQFSIVSKAEDKEFKKLIEKDNNNIQEKNLLLLKPLLNKIFNIDLNNDDTILENYLESLKDYAEKSESKDEYANSPLFVAEKFDVESDNELNDLLISIRKLLESKKYNEIIDEYLGTDNLKKLLKKLINISCENKNNITIIEITNSLIETIKGILDEKSALSTIEELDFLEIAKNKLEVIFFNDFVNKLKNEKIIEQEESLRFIIEVKRKKYTKIDRIKKHMAQCPSLTNAFKYYDDPYTYVMKLIEAGVLQDVIYKMLIDIDFKVVNKDDGTEISGGEQAEYVLYSELKDANKYDIVLIDEPESSFDNIFLRDKIQEKIKNLALKTTVFIVTHNSTLGILMNPDKIIYTQKEGANQYNVYTGTLTSSVFKNINGKEIGSYKTLMDIMEAGEESFKRKEEIYEIIKD